MLTGTFEMMFSDFVNALQDVRDISGKPLRIYNAYKECIILSAIKTLKKIILPIDSQDHKKLCDLLIQFNNEYQKLIN